MNLNNFQDLEHFKMWLLINGLISVQFINKHYACKFEKLIKNLTSLVVQIKNYNGYNDVNK